MAERLPARFGNYILLGRIGFGGMAEVFRAATIGPKGFSRLLAIKRILPNIIEDEASISMFIDEAKISSELHHANICYIHDFGQIADSYYLAMEYVAGQSLHALQRHFIKQQSLIPRQFVLQVIRQVCDALDYAHNLKDARQQPRGIVHRDIKPANILLSYEGEVKLIDFGIAKAAARSTVTQGGFAKGTFRYMSPEQVQQLPVDGRSDIFALGLVLHELLTGQPVFEGGVDFQGLQKVVNAEIRPPSAVRASLPPELDRLVMKALAKEPADRYQTAGEMQRAIEDYAATLGRPCNRQNLAELLQLTFREEFEAEHEQLVRMEELAQRGIELAALPVVESRRPVDLGVTDEEAELAAPVGPPSSPSSRPGLTTDSIRFRQPPAPAAPSASPSAPPSGAPPHRTGFTWLLVAGLLVLLIGGGLGGWLLWPRTAPDPLARGTGAPEVGSVGHPPRELLLSSSPEGARVEVSGDEESFVLGGPTTPTTLRGLQTGQRYLIRMSLAGYQARERELVWGPDASSSLLLQLRPEAAPDGGGGPTEPESPRTAVAAARTGREGRGASSRSRGERAAERTERTDPDGRSTRAAEDPDRTPVAAPVAERPAPAEAPTSSALAERPVVSREPPTDPPAVTATPDWGLLAIESEVPGTVFVDGTNTGKTTPTKLRLAPGPHEVVVLLEGSEMKVRHAVVVKAGRKVTLKVAGVR